MFGGGSPTKSYPTSPAGMLVGDAFGSRKAGQRWAAAERQISLGQIAVGLFILAISARYLYQFTEATGLVLGALLVASGAAGYVGGTRRSPNLVNAQLVLSIVGILLAFQFVGEVVRDAQVDCALAELHHRGRATERALEETRSAEALHAVYDRLNELEDSLAGGGAASEALRREQAALRATDLNYVRAKVEMVRRHAEDVLNSVLKNEAVNAATIATMSEEEKTGLRRRLDTADRVMDRIAKVHASDNPNPDPNGGINGAEVNSVNPAAVLSFEEYREILAALTDVASVPDKAQHPELLQAVRELPNMQAALQRQRADAYHTLMVGAAGAEIQRSAAARRAKRERFENAFRTQLERKNEKGKDYVADLPEHCVKETAGERVAVATGLAVAVVQAAAAYVALSLAVRLPTKAE